MQGDLEKLEQHYQLSAEGIREQLTNKLVTSRNRIVKLVDRLYEKLQKSVEVIYSAYLLESERNQLELRKLSAPLLECLSTVDNYKQ